MRAEGGKRAVPVGTLDISSYRDDGAARPATRACSAATSRSRSIATASCWSTTCSTPDVRCAPRSTRWPISDDPNRFSSRCWSIAASANCRFAPTTSASNIEAPRDQRVYVRLAEVDGVDEVVIGGAKRRAAGLSAMARLGKYDIVSIEDLTTVDIERMFELADSFAAGLEGGETMTTAARPYHGDAFLRAVDPHAPEFRIRDASARRRRHQLRRHARELCRQGRKPGRHRARGGRLCRPDRGAPSARRRRARRRRVRAMPRDQRRRRQPRASDADAVRPLHPAPQEGASEGTDGRHLRRFEIRPHRPFADLCARPFRREHRRRAVQRDERAGLRAGARRRRKQVRSFDGHDG